MIWSHARRLLLLACFFFFFSCDPECDVPLAASWYEHPSIEICDDVRFEEQRIVNSLEWWHSISLAYDYKEIRYSDCLGITEDGWIRFRAANKATLEERQAVAYTMMYFDASTGEMLAADVFYRVDPPNHISTIRHEIGHAYGWMHTNEKHHVMKPGSYWRTCGLDSYPLSGNLNDSALWGKLPLEARQTIIYCRMEGT